MTSRYSRCRQCGGKGYHWARIRDHGKRQMVDSIVPCMFPGCNRGTVDREENYRILMGLPEPEPETCPDPDSTPDTTVLVF